MALPETVCELLESHVEKQKLNPNNKFNLLSKNGIPYNLNSVTNRLKVLCKETDVSELKFHELRHTHAIIFLLFFHLFAPDFTNILWCFHRFSCTYGLNYTQISIECGFVISLT